MRKTKEQKGITLVALIITIVVLLILALVTINAVRGDGIIGKAQKAKDEYQRKSDEEQSTLEGYLAYLEKNAPGGSSSDSTEDNNGDNEDNNSQEGTEEDTVIKPQIGDKVAYDEGSEKTSSIDSSFVMKDMEWRILDIEEDGTIELISTQPTDSTLTLSGQEGWLNAETNLDTLCNDLYANGTGVKARSLKVEDIDKLAGITTDADRQALYSSYGSLWQYQYSATVGYMQYRKSTDNGSTWSDWTDITNSSRQKFTEPGKATINITSYQDSDGNPRIADLIYTYYGYTISSEMKRTTSDGISIASLITQGLNDDNNSNYGTNVMQWLSSRCALCTSNYVDFSVRTVSTGTVSNGVMCYSSGGSYTKACNVRPVVTLPSNVTLTNVDGVWQINM